MIVLPAGVNLSLFSRFISNALMVEAQVRIWLKRMNPLRLGEVALILNSRTKTKKAVDGRREIAKYLPQLLAVQGTQERVYE